MAPTALVGRLLVGGSLRRGVVHLDAGRISRIDFGDLPSPTGALEADIVSAGLIDLQVNGAFGYEIGADAEAIRGLAAKLPTTGVTAFLPTLTSSSREVYHEAYAAFAAARDAPGAKPLGLHLEGPYLSPSKVGAHDRAAIAAADDRLFDELARDVALRLMTLAPEREGALGRIHRLRERGVVVSLGHTDADYETFRAGIDAGATMVTHLFNAMSALHHRSPGAVGASLGDERVVVGLIADGIHSHPGALQLALRAKGARGIALVTDAMAAAGMGSGRYGLGGQTVLVDESSARLPDGTLAGSILTLDEGVRRMVRFGGATPSEALTMASAVPARLLGLDDQGDIRIGARADLVLWDASLRVVRTLIGGVVP